MPTEILLPQWGMEMDEGTVVRWLKKEGDPVQEGEPLVEIETAKLTTELESFASGILTRIVVPEGGTVPIRAVLAILTAPGEEVAAPEPSSASSASAGPGAAVSVPATAYAGQVVPAARRLAREHNVALAKVHGSGPNGRILIADVERAIEAAKSTVSPVETAPAPVGQVVPAARRLAREQGVDLTGVRGSGPNGRILIADVERAISSLQVSACPNRRFRPVTTTGAFRGDTPHYCISNAEQPADDGPGYADHRGRRVRGHDVCGKDCPAMPTVRD